MNRIGDGENRLRPEDGQVRNPESHATRRKAAASKLIARATPMAALNAALTIASAPLSYGPIQLRFCEASTAPVLVRPWLIPGSLAGAFITDLFSRYDGPRELVCMPAIGSRAEYPYGMKRRRWARGRL